MLMRNKCKKLTLLLQLIELQILALNFPRFLGTFENHWINSL